MNRIKILNAEIEALERKQSQHNFIKLINPEKLDYINDELKVIKKQIEIINVLVNREWSKKKVEEVIGKPPEENERQKEIIKLIKENEHKMSTLMHCKISAMK